VTTVIFPAQKRRKPNSPEFFQPKPAKEVIDSDHSIGPPPFPENIGSTFLKQGLPRRDRNASPLAASRLGAAA
jgi:hypothetical protein